MQASDPFDYGDELNTGRAPRQVAALVVGIFLSSLVGTGLLDICLPLKGMTPVGIEAQALQRQARQANLWDGSLARRFERRLRKRSRTRQRLTPHYTYFAFAYLDEAPPGFLVGQEHWLFRKEHIQLVEFDEATAAGSAINAIAALDRRLAAHHIELSTVPIPRKSYVARDFLPRGVNPQHNLDDLLIDGLIASGVSTVDLREPFGQYDPLEIYFKLDTHWTPHAARLTAQAMAASTGDLKPKGQRLGKLNLKSMPLGTPTSVALLRSFGVIPQDHNLDALGLRSPQFSTYAFGERAAWFEHPQAGTPRALSGTSFSKNQSLAKALSHYTGQPVFTVSEPAKAYMETMAQLLAANLEAGKELRHIDFETPIAGIFIPYNSRGAHTPWPFLRIFELLPPVNSTGLLKLPKRWLPFGLGRTIQLAKKANTTLLIIQSDWIAHTGDGVLAVTVTGELTGEPTSIWITSKGTSYAHRLNPGKFELSFPLLASGPTTHGYRIVAAGQPKAQIRIDSAELIHEPGNSRRTPLIPRPSGTGITLSPKSPVTTTRHSTALIKTQSTSGTPATVTLRIHMEAGAPREIDFKAFRPGGLIAVDLGAQSGLRLDRIELLGAQPGLSIKSAVITGTAQD